MLQLSDTSHNFLKVLLHSFKILQYMWILGLFELTTKCKGSLSEIFACHIFMVKLIYIYITNIWELVMIWVPTSCQLFRWLALYQRIPASVKSPGVLPLTSAKPGFHLSHYSCITQKKLRIEPNVLPLQLCFLKQFFLGCTMKSFWALQALRKGLSYQQNHKAISWSDLSSV